MQNKSAVKEPYEKPVLRVIQLAEEEIMGFCKASAISPGQLSIACSNCFHSYNGS